MRRKVCSLLPFPLLDGALPQSHTSLGCGIPFSSEAKHQSHVCKSAYLFQASKAERTFLEAVSSAHEFYCFQCLQSTPRWFLYLQRCVYAGFSNDACFNCNSKHYSGRAGRRKMTRTRQGLTTSHPLCERPGLFA